MVAQAARDVLIKLETSPAVFTTIAMVSASIELNGGAADVSDNQSPGQWQENEMNFGIRSLSLSGDAICKGSAAEKALHNVWFNRTKPNFQAVVPGLGTYQGPFGVPTFSFAGKKDGEATYSVSMVSAGEIVFTAE